MCTITQRRSSTGYFSATARRDRAISSMAASPTMWIWNCQPREAAIMNISLSSASPPGAEGSICRRNSDRSARHRQSGKAPAYRPPRYRRPPNLKPPIRSQSSPKSGAKRTTAPRHRPRSSNRCRRPTRVVICFLRHNSMSRRISSSVSPGSSVLVTPRRSTSS